MKKAFTLAEIIVVITLIGVVAAITIPNTMQNTSRKANVVKVKRTYSLLSNAYDNYLAINQNSISPQYYSEQGATNVAKAFIDYLPVLHDVGTSPAEKAKYMYSGNYTNRDGGNPYNIYIVRGSYYLVVLKDGGQIWFKGIENTNRADGVASEIFYDLNGKKGPNRRGEDFFIFNIVGRTIVPGGAMERYNYFDEACAPKNSSGWGCAAWVIYKGNFDYLNCEGLRLAIDSSCGR